MSCAGQTGTFQVTTHVRAVPGCACWAHAVLPCMRALCCVLCCAVQVNKVAGNFHFAAGHSYQQGSMHIHDMAPFTDKTLDFTHTIKGLSFGKPYPVSNTRAHAELFWSYSCSIGSIASAWALRPLQSRSALSDPLSGDALLRLTVGCAGGSACVLQGMKNPLDGVSQVTPHHNKPEDKAKKAVTGMYQYFLKVRHSARRWGAGVGCWGWL